MIVIKEFPDRQFATKDEMFTALRKHGKELIDLKKATIMKSCDKGGLISFNPNLVAKSLEQTKSFEVNENYHYIVVNTTKVLDSHNDLHVDGIWEQTVKQQQGKNYLVADHRLEIDKVIAKSKDVEMFTAEIPFSLVGKDYEGNTQALIYKVAKDKVINPTIKEWLDSGDDIQASVRMQYVKIELAMNSIDKEDIAEKATFDKYVTEIANKSEHNEIDYFFVVKEAKNIKESSLVLFGSNSATGIVEPIKITQTKEEPSIDTQIKRRRII